MERLLARLAELGVEARTVAHPPLFTVAESQALRGELPGTHVKNLFLKPAKGEWPFCLAVLEENRRVSVNALARLAGWGRVAMAEAEALRATLGVEPGSVTPFGLMNAPPGTVRLALDRAVAAAPALVWCHPLVNTASTGVAAAGLLRFLEAAGHPPHILDLDGG